MNLLLKDKTYIIKMGRKTRNKSKKDDKNIILEESDDNYSDEDDNLEEIENKELNLISDIRENILEYCELNCIPLCDYLTNDKLMNLLYFFKEEYS